MPPKYNIGDKVIVTSAKNQSLSARDSEIGLYVGQNGEVTNYYWINPTRSRNFYIYTVRIGASDKEIVLHEDEIESRTT